MFTDRKLIVSGDVVHYYQYSKLIEYGENNRRNKLRIKHDEDSQKTEKVKFDSSVYRTKRQVKFILQANAYKYFNDKFRSIPPMFYTFTFRENITGLKEANRQYGDFIKRLNYLFYKSDVNKIKYLNVPEFQKRGAVHYHTVFFNLPYEKNILKGIEKIWGQGFVFVRKVKNLRHLTAYVTKYITKENRDERLLGQKGYFCSRGLFRPSVIYNKDIIEFTMSMMGEPSYEKEFKTKDLTTKYQCFDGSVDNEVAKTLHSAKLILPMVRQR